MSKDNTSNIIDITDLVRAPDGCISLTQEEEDRLLSKRTKAKLDQVANETLDSIAATVPDVEIDQS